MIMKSTKYPIGIQTFEQLRNRDCVYVDKTTFIHQLVCCGVTTFFLSRPRRFGKSLLLSTIDAYFKGRKDLFEGLAIYELEKEWKSYPVLHFDFSESQAKSSEVLTEFILWNLNCYEKEFGITETSVIKDVGLRFGALIEKIYQATGKEVVILIDEYDKGILEVLENTEQLEANQDILRPFFSQIKAKGKYLRFCLITGVARFRNYTIFSGFNNPKDLSMDPKYACICGITKEELLENFNESIISLAENIGLTFDQTVEQLRLKYDGYRFTSSREMVYNPFSILNCFDTDQLENYWVSSGSSKVFVDYLSKSRFDLLDLENMWVTKSRMESTYSTTDPIPLLFQTGYLTIKEFDMGLYRLGIPNGEVRNSLVDDLIPRYMGIDKDDLPLMMRDLRRKLDSADINGFMRILQSLVAKIPYQEMDMENLERTYHLVIYELFLIMGVESRSEVSMSGGRIDLVVETRNYVYVIEFKLGGSVEDALAQIDDRGYHLPWSADGRHVYKIGAVFSPETRTLAEWQSN